MTRNSESGDSVSEEGRGSDSSTTDPGSSTGETPAALCTDGGTTVPNPAPSAVPEALRERDQWLLWDASNHAPRRPHWGGDFSINWTDPGDWHSFAEALPLAKKHASWGIGFVVSEGDPFTVLDVDGGYRLGDDDGEDETDAVERHDWVPDHADLRADTYAEWSPSRTGEHLWLTNETVPEGFTHPTEEHTGLDVLDNKFVTVTGGRIDGAAETVGCVDDEALSRFFRDAHARLRGEAHPTEGITPDGSGPGGESNVGIYDLISRAEYPVGKRRAHPAHGSGTGANFAVSDEAEGFWNCYSDGCSGGKRGITGGHALHLLGVLEGILECGEWHDRDVTAEVWRQIYDAARERGLGVGDPPDEGESGSGNGNASGGERTGGPSAEPDDDASLADEWEYIRGCYADEEDPESNRVADNRAVRALRRDERTAFVTDTGTGVLYRYDPESGTYEPDGEDVARSMLTNDPGDTAARGPAALAETSVTADDDQYRLGDAAQPARCNRIISLLKSRTRVDVLGGDATPEGYVVVENCLLNLNPMLEKARAGEQADYTDVRREAFTHEQVHRRHFHTAYDPDADPTDSEFTEKLAENVAGTGLDRLQEFAGYCHLPWDQPFKKALLCVGPTNSGKSRTYLSVLHELVGEQNDASVRLGDLGGGGNDAMYAADDLHDALVSIRNELDATTLTHLSLFKEVVGGTDPIRARPPYGDPYSFIPTAKLLYAANRVPEVENADDAFYDRWLHVRFPESIPKDEQDRDLYGRLIENELPAVLNWALTGLARLVRNDGAFTGELSVHEKRALWTEYGSAFDRFIQRIDVTNDHAHTVRKTKLHQLYVAFSAHIGADDPMDQGQFTKELSTVDGIDAQGDRYTGVRIPDNLRQTLARAATGSARRGALGDRDCGGDDGKGESDAERDASDPRPTGLGDYN